MNETTRLWQAIRLAALALATMLAIALSSSAMPARAHADEGGGLQAGSIVDLVTQAYKSVTTDEGWVWRSDDGSSAVLVGYVGASATPRVPAAVEGRPVTGVIAKVSTGSPTLASIDLSAVKGTLEKIQIRGCKLGSLDLSGYDKLAYADVSEDGLASLKVPAGMTELRCAGNDLEALDVSSCASLEKLDCSSNKIRALELAACPGLYWLDCHDNYLTGLRCGANLQLADVFCHGNYIADDLAALAARYGSDAGVVLPQNAGQPPAASGSGGNSGGNSGSGQGGSAAASGAAAGAKAANTLSVKAKTVKLKSSKVKKKKQTVKPAKAFAVSGAQGKVTYKVAAYDKKAKKKVKVSAAGKVTVKKGLKKGTYKLKVAVTAAGDATHLPATKTVTLKVKVK